MYPKKKLAQLVITACEQYHIKTIVISPGSRNAPLTIGFSNSEKINTLSIVDERCAAFFALGIAQQTQEPVAIVCTSGSALLNYYPAIAEAYYSKIPLLVISADRPKHLIDIGDGQTIRQEHVLNNHIIYEANLVEDDSEHNAKYICTTIHAARLKKGPVHINVPFNEPLYETVEVIGSDVTEEIAIEKSRIKSLDPFNIDYKNLSEIWNNSTRKLIIVGVNNPSERLQKVIDEIAEDESVLVFIEATSNLHNEKFVNSIDKLITKLTEDDFKKLQPELLITLGGMVVSKRIKKMLRTYSPAHHWHIDSTREMNTYFCLSEYIKKEPEIFFNEIKSRITKVKSNYRDTWVEEKYARTEKHDSFIKEVKYSDFKVFDIVLKSIPNYRQLQVSNSSIIRYVQLFDVNPTLEIFCNRGTSGIDGSTSTAIGAAYINTTQTICITGDLSFFYDSNALWNTNIPKNFRIIIVNNSGGGIFKIIPGPKSTNALPYFEVPHQLTAEHLAKMYDFEYKSVSDAESLQYELINFYKKTNQPKILEIFTPSNLNDEVLKQYFNSL